MSIKKRVLDAIGTGNVSLESLALKVGKARKVEVVQVDDDFRDTLWSMLDDGQIDLDWNMNIYRPDIGTRNKK